MKITSFVLSFAQFSLDFYETCNIGLYNNALDELENLIRLTIF